MGYVEPDLATLISIDLVEYWPDFDLEGAHG